MAKSLPKKWKSELKLNILLLKRPTFTFLVGILPSSTLRTFWGGTIRKKHPVYSVSQYRLVMVEIILHWIDDKAFEVQGWSSGLLYIQKHEIIWLTFRNILVILHFTKIKRSISYCFLMTKLIYVEILVLLGDYKMTIASGFCCPVFFIIGMAYL